MFCSDGDGAVAVRLLFGDSEHPDSPVEDAGAHGVFSRRCEILGEASVRREGSSSRSEKASCGCFFF